MGGGVRRFEIASYDFAAVQPAALDLALAFEGRIK
jgi:hypothetical protein